MDTIVLTKIISALVYPIGLIGLLIILSIVFAWLKARRLKHICRVLAVLILVLTSNPKFAKFLASQLEQQYPQNVLSVIDRHDAIIVLGGGLRIPLRPAQHTQIGAGSDRLWYAVRLYRAGLADKIILTGGNVYAQPKVASEAEYAAELLRDWGVPASAILAETGSRTTRQNKEKTALFLTQHNIESALLVTSALHMPRAYRLFKQLPITITPASADVLIRQQRSPALLDWIPSATALSLSTVALHEYYGLIAQRIQNQRIQNSLR